MIGSGTDRGTSAGGRRWRRGGHWILRIKGNQKTLHAWLKALPWQQVPEAARVRSIGHGRAEIRTIRVIDLDGSHDGCGDFFPTPARLKIIRRRRDRGGRWSEPFPVAP